MTSEDYARLCLRTLRYVVDDIYGLDDAERFMGDDYKRLSIMLLTRIMGPGQDEYEVDSDTQAVETKPVGELVVDIEEEITDLVAYAVALKDRTSINDECDALVALGLEAMAIAQRIKGVLGE